MCVHKKAALLLLLLVVAVGGVYAYTVFNVVIVNVQGPCVESDTGLDYTTQGFVRGNFWWTYQNQTTYYNGTFYDACLDNTTLVEGVCGRNVNANLSNLAAMVYVNCNTNGTGECRNGSCVSTSGGSSTTNNTCADTDGGVNLAVRGSTYGWNGGSYYNHSDYCVTGSGYGNVRIAEGYCSSNSVQVMHQNCPTNTTCQSGKCI